MCSEEGTLLAKVKVIGILCEKKQNLRVCFGGYQSLLWGH